MLSVKTRYGTPAGAGLHWLGESETWQIAQEIFGLHTDEKWLIATALLDTMRCSMLSMELPDVAVVTAQDDVLGEGGGEIWHIAEGASRCHPPTGTTCWVRARFGTLLRVLPAVVAAAVPNWLVFSVLGGGDYAEARI
ncbi:unnamed protein product [Zymoseptoria tritici ST99CH_1A5]|uniref:Uncharacterized protein n=1 Tax=Zymoseptoria tritici ST99CH_1A5 TaxID=1276529 RepID=A0A1Y6LKR6_ZYMTR|nr:unnamed protein product [Zymoseptoria tritici ST99CH_1A5]